MGESNPEAAALIEELLGEAPRHDLTPEGQQCLHIGGTTLVATEFALWSDPFVWQHDDDMFSVQWGGQVARFMRGQDGIWLATTARDPLVGKARWVS